MPRKFLAVLVSSAVLWTSLASAAQPAAEPVKPAPAATAPKAATPAGNTSPLPAGPARIKTAQGLEEDDLGPGIIILSWAAAIGIAFAVAFSGGDDEDESPPTTGTN
jgi:hypothetical protein